MNMYTYMEVYLRCLASSSRINYSLSYYRLQGDEPLAKTHCPVGDGGVMCVSVLTDKILTTRFPSALPFKSGSWGNPFASLPKLRSLFPQLRALAAQPLASTVPVRNSHH